MAGDKEGRVVFIGNIPYGLSEEQITDLLKQAGEVLSFRLIYDKDTAKPKGYGFAEFRHVDSAHTAVRNLDRHEVMGRNLRVAFSNESGSGEKEDHSTAQQNGNTAPSAANAQSNLPAGTELPPGLTAPDAISRTLGSFPQPQLLDIISQMKQVATADPAKVTELFKTQPQLACATLQALLLLQLVDHSVLAAVVQQQVNQPQAPAPMLSAPPPMYPPGPQLVPPPPPQMHAPAPPPGYGYPPAPAPAPAPEPTPQFPVFGAGTDMNSLRQQVFSITDDQLSGMDATTRNTVLSVRQGFLVGHYR